MVTAPELYFHIKKILQNNNTDSPQFEAMCITEHIFNMPLSQLLLNKTPASQHQITVADNITCRRCQGEPLQYLLGKWEFYGREFYVGEGVLIPRQDTETLIETVLNLNIAKNPKILDLCSGSGCIGITLASEFQHSDVTAVEISEKASGYINKNIKLNNVSMKLVTGDVLNAKIALSFSDTDLIVCNPPYLSSNDMANLQKEVSFEPELALFGGTDGLDFYRNITYIWKNSLKSDGFLVYEIGMNQENDVIEIMKSNNFKNINTSDDLCGITRVVYGQK